MVPPTTFHVERHLGQHLVTDWAAFHEVKTQRVEESKLGSAEKRRKQSNGMEKQKGATETGKIKRKQMKWKDRQEREAELELRERKQ